MIEKLSIMQQIGGFILVRCMAATQEDAAPWDNLLTQELTWNFVRLLDTQMVVSFVWNLGCRRAVGLLL